MSQTFLLGLVAVGVVALGLRLALPSLPLARFARRLSGLDALLVVLGLLGLVFHCGAMFFLSTFRQLPASDAAIHAVRGMGTASQLLYVVPAVLVLLGLRGAHWLPFGLVGLALVAVGVTMYDGGALDTHLSAIFASVVVLAVTLAFTTSPPWSPHPR